MNLTKVLKFIHVISDPIWIENRGISKAMRCLIAQNTHNKKIWLDVGCGQRPYEFLFKDCKYIGLDVEESGRPNHMKQPDLYYDGNNFPLDSNSFDGVLCTQVLEHVKNPSGLIQEMSRVLRKDGVVILSAPLTWREHEAPFDFFRYTEFGLTALFAEHGLVIKEVKKSSGGIEAIAQLISVYIVNNWKLPFKGGGILISLFLCMPIQVFGVLLQKILPDSRDLYLDNVVLAQKEK